MNTAEFVAQNLLEQRLMDAAKDPAARPVFMTMLLDSLVLIVPQGDPPQMVNHVLPAGTQISLAIVQHQGQKYVPFFTSDKRLPQGTRFFQIKVRDFFELTKGAHLVMNPGCLYGKAFVPQEVAALLDGSYFKPGDTRVVEGGVKIMVGHPAKYPQELADALSRLYAKTPAVKRAFLALYHDPRRDSEPGLLVLLDVDSEAAMQRASAESGVVINGIAKTHKYVDIARYDPNGLGKFLAEKNFNPFYTRA